MMSIWAGLLLFIMWTDDNLLLDLVMWFLVSGVTFWGMVIVCEVCFQFQGRSRTNRAVIKALLGGDVLCLYVPQRVAYVAGGSLRRLKIRLSVLGREQDLDYATLRGVREIGDVHQEINDFPVHDHNITVPMSESTSAQEVSSSLASLEVPTNVDLDKQALVVELLCAVCTVPLGAGVPLLTLPCLHQFHLECIFDGVGSQLICPACKFPADLRRYPMREDEITLSL